MIVRCADCGLVSLVDEDGTERPRCEYDQSYYAGGDESRPWGYVDYLGSERAIRDRTSMEVERLVRSYYGLPATLLDIGCGAGYFVRAARRGGWDAAGIDSSPEAPAMARMLGVEPYVHSIPLERVDAGARFEVVTMFDLIEHVDDPVSALRQGLGLVRPGGMLFVTTPRFGGWLYRQQLDRYVQFKRDHLFYFTETTLTRAAERAGAADWEMTRIDTAMRVRLKQFDHSVREKYELRRDTLLMAITRPADGPAPTP